MSEPTLGEVVRRLEDIAKQMAGLLAEIKGERAHVERTYLPRETYNAEKELLKASVATVAGDVADINEARKDDARWRRTASLTLAVAAAGWLVTIALFIATILNGA